MNQDIRQMTKYFRNAMAVQKQAVIDFKHQESSFELLGMEQFVEGYVPDSIYKKYNKIMTQNGEKKEEQLSNIDVIIAAKTIRNEILEGNSTENNIEELTGIFYVPAQLSFNNQLLPPVKKMPWFAREVLEPMIEPRLLIGKVADSDCFIENTTDRREKIGTWKQYVDYCKEYYWNVSNHFFEQVDFGDNIKFEQNTYLFMDERIEASFHIKQLYNDLLDTKEHLKLYERYMNLSVEPIFPLIKNDSAKKMIEHCGQMGGIFELASSQREAINHLNELKNGDILAISGPPGTGKTTLLQSVVANLFVKHAIEQKQAPIIVASSTNNQAVTNIIDSFGKINILGIKNIEDRWIPEIESFALYYPSQGKIKESRKGGYQFTDINWQYFASKVDSDEFKIRAKEKFIQECNTYFMSEYSNVESCQSIIHQNLVQVNTLRSQLINRLDEINKENKDVTKAIQEIECNKVIIQENIEAIIEGESNFQQLIQKYKQRIQEWDSIYKKIPWILKVLSFFLFIKKKIITELKLNMVEEEFDFLYKINSYDEIREIYVDKISEISKEILEYKNKKNIFKAELVKCEEKILKYKTIQKEVKGYFLEFKTLNCDIWFDDIKDSKEKKGTYYDKTEQILSSCNLEEINKLIDTRVRYIEFWLAAHYYEAEFLKTKKLSENERKSNIMEVFDKMYHKLAMLTPCMVMTFFMLPKSFRVYNYNSKLSTYLYNFIDLLIVDEAGQVTPEISAPAFSLAKKAIIVGDENQIPPVWGIEKALDMTLAIESGVIHNKDEFKRLQEYGLNCSESNTMRVAKKSCNYKKHEKGLFLSEHRRCYNEIINYCNELVYGNHLELCRGKGEDDKNYPLRGYPHIAHYDTKIGQSQKRGVSRINEEEAKEIAKWLGIHYSIIANAYVRNKTKENEIIAIITPFKAQVAIIKKEISKVLDKKAKNIAVGTVHTFQGAERKIIILSTVYGEEEGCYFINNNKSLLNVAVSRAKDAFWVFGAYNCLDKDENSVSGLLRKYTSLSLNNRDTIN